MTTVSTSQLVDLARQRGHWQHTAESLARQLTDTETACRDQRAEARRLIVDLLAELGRQTADPRSVDRELLAQARRWVGGE